MRRRILRTAMAAVALLASTPLFGQQLLDRVLDRVDQELGRNQPIPVEAENAPAQPAINGEPGYLGVIADDRQEQGQGIRVLDVLAGGPAATGGLTKGDLVVAINDRPVGTMDEMGRILSAFGAGEKVKFSVRRGEAVQAVTVLLGQRPNGAERKFEQFGRQPEELPNGAGGTAPRPKLGVRTLPVTDEARRQFNLNTRDGALVVSVTKGSPADRAGIPIGGVIGLINNVAVKDPDALADLVADGFAKGQLTIGYEAEGQQMRVNIPLPGGAARKAAEPGPSDAVIADKVVKPDVKVVDKPVIPGSDESRIESMERRMQLLEDRLEKIEQLLQQKAGG